MRKLVWNMDTGKSFSEALILASTNPQYNNRLFLELHVQYMKIASSELAENMLCTEIVLNAKTKTNLCTQHVHHMYKKSVMKKRFLIENFLHWLKSIGTLDHYAFKVNV